MKKKRSIYNNWLFVEIFHSISCWYETKCTRFCTNWTSSRIKNRTEYVDFVMWIGRIAPILHVSNFWSLIISLRIIHGMFHIHLECLMMTAQEARKPSNLFSFNQIRNRYLCVCISQSMRSNWQIDRVKEEMKKKKKKNEVNATLLFVDMIFDINY